MSALTIEQMTQQLSQYPADARVLIYNQSGLPFTYAVTGIISAAGFNVSHLFDKDVAPPPEDECVYLLIRIETS